MKKIYNKKWTFSCFLAAIAGIFFLFSFSSCQLFTPADLEENLTEASDEAVVSSNGKDGFLTLVINPRLEDGTNAASRNAYPDFESELSNFEFYAVCESVFGEAQGEYNSTDKTVTFTIRSISFSSDTIIKIFARDSSSHQDLLYAELKGINYTIGTDVSVSSNLYFQSYTSELGREEDNPIPNGLINLQVSSSSETLVVCNVYTSGSTPVQVSGNSGSGKAIEITGSSDYVRNINTIGSGITPGKYTARIYIYKDGTTNSNPDYREEIINVWPGITTNLWYLSNGNKTQNLTIVPTPGVKFYVKGSGSTGPYASGGVSIDTTAIPGSIKNPFSSINDAIAKCTSSTTDYRIIVCGSVEESVQINSSLGAKTITIEGASSFDTDIIQNPAGENANPTFYLKKSDITIKNLQITGGRSGGIYLYNINNGKITIDSCKLYQNIGDGGLKVSSSTATVKVINCEISHNHSNMYGGGINPDENCTVEVEDTKILYNTSGTCGGGFYIPKDCRLSCKNGIISNNSSGAGGAVGISQGFFEISGSVYIPYGVEGVFGPGKNDIHNRVTLADSIIIKSKLTPPEEAGGIVGAVTPCWYNTSCPTLITLDSSVTDTTLKKELKKFTLVQDAANPATTWAFTSTGGLQEAVEFAYPASTAGSFNGSTQISEVFKQNRKIGNIKSIVASDHETTQGEYELYCKYFSGCEPTTAIGKGDYYPVYKVSWYDAIIYCNLRSIAEGYEPVYVVGGKTNPAQWTGIDGNSTEGYCAPSGCTWDVTILADKNGWRLPTEIEWEYLARGGDLTASSYTYSGSNTASDVAWYGGSGGTAGGKVHPVKGKNPNGFNLYDMSGNVWEWTNDLHSNAVDPGPWIPVDTPSSGSYPDKSNSKRVTKGGGWSGAVAQSPVYNRGSSAPNDRNQDMGFRVVRGAQYVGSKLPSVYKEVGDIVFNDGSAMAYTDFAAITDTSVKNEKKAAAIALIFYKGSGLNSGSDTTTIRTLGLGLKHNNSGKSWCNPSADACYKNITSIQCNVSGDWGALTITGDKNGSDNLEQIEAFEGVDDTADEYYYGAFYFGKKYATLFVSNIPAESVFAKGWYLPSVAELFQIYVTKNNGFDIDTVSYALGGDRFGNGKYWTSSQDPSTAGYAFELNLSAGNASSYYKSNAVNINVCCIREF
ncbi:MAG: SUMF1/EgtB/PvdO family nonheme iron enzyme [Spirochaetales bacterium]|nr:SUMF1/EgtB/PvdO family nonheme iron enzyme [Spirochaetales bacterium]